MARLVFAGHESFSCKLFWLKKGYEFLSNGKSFSSDSAVIDLGVGKNMVRSIKFWVHAFGVAKNNSSVTELGQYLFGDNGVDPYLEDIGSIWLLHYHLVKLGHASIYNLIFNDFKKTKFEFQKEHLHHFLKLKCLNNKSTVYNENTINRDIKVFLRNYLQPRKKRNEIEDAFTGLLHELNILNNYYKEDLDSKKNLEWYSIENNTRPNLPCHILLFAILDNPVYGQTISFKNLQFAVNSPGMVFAINAEGLHTKINEICKNDLRINYSETAGNQLLQLNSEISKWDVLNEYYK